MHVMQDSSAFQRLSVTLNAYQTLGLDPDTPLPLLSLDSALEIHAPEDTAAGYFFSESKA